MERAMQQMESMKNGAYVKRLRDSGYSSDIVELVEADIKYGLTEEQTGLYLKKNIKYPQMKVMSQCLRKGADNDFIQMLTKYSWTDIRCRLRLILWRRVFLRRA